MREFYFAKYTAKYFGWRWVMVDVAGWRIRRLHESDAGYMIRVEFVWRRLEKEPWYPLFNASDIETENIYKDI